MKLDYTEEDLQPLYNLVENISHKQDILLIAGKHDVGKSQILKSLYIYSKALSNTNYKATDGVVYIGDNNCTYLDYLDLQSTNSNDRVNRILTQLRKYSSNTLNIYIDNLGEGLHRYKSIELIENIYLILKENKSKAVIISNNRGIINSVPLEAILVIDNIESNRYVINSIDNKKLYDEYMLSGLSNYDFIIRDHSLEDLFN